ncbi:Serine/threonine-protein kinase Chk2 [Nymphon striatum]|nr:Serine/threonine-protein kinase Chk2 [Nymphon striatum]
MSYQYFDELPAEAKGQYLENLRVADLKACPYQVPEGCWSRDKCQRGLMWNLCGQEIKFGRDDECNYSFCDGQEDPSVLLAYSKIHFILIREELSTGFHTFLKDTSSNGTFINGTKVGKNMQQVLNNNDEISLLSKKNKAFIYVDLELKENGNYPDSVLNTYTVSKFLGRGACGEVRLVFKKDDCCQAFAMKIIAKKKFSIGGSILKVRNSNTLVDLSAQVQNEVNVMKNLDHPCIVKIENVIDTPDYLYIILELVEGGELFDRIVSCKKLKESNAKLLFYQMVLAVQYLHSQGITHRDLKAENILLTNEEDQTLIKVTDFGLSKLINSSTVMQTFCGTPNYLAPEILISGGKGRYTNAIDCWSLGVILYVCLSGSPPFSNDYPGNVPLAEQIKTGRYSFPNKLWKDVSEDAKDLVRKFLTVKPEERITLDAAIKHPWLQDEDIIDTANKLMYGSKESPSLSTKVITKRTIEKINTEEEISIQNKRTKSEES